MDDEQLKISKADKLNLIFNYCHPLHDFQGLAQKYYESNNIYLGSMYAVNQQCIYQKQIGAILTIMDRKSYDKIKMQEKIAFLGLQQNHLFIDAEDSKDIKIQPYFINVQNFLNRCMDNKVNVLIHCKMGMSRSPSILCAYVMKNFNLTFEQAYKLIKQRRKIVKINQGFESELRKYQKQLKLKK